MNLHKSQIGNPIEDDSPRKSVLKSNEQKESSQRKSALKSPVRELNQRKSV